MAQRGFIRTAVWTIIGILAAAGLGSAPLEPGERAVTAVQAEIAAVRAGTAEIVRSFGADSPMVRDLRQLLARYPEPAAARPMLLGTRPAKLLVPLVIDAQTVGGFFQLSPDGSRILSYLPWDAAGRPLFVVSRERWQQARTANELPELVDLVPLAEQPSPGVPIELADLDSYEIIDGIDRLPSKTQEELPAQVARLGVKERKGRRSGTSKCLSYAAALVSDWWRARAGLPHPPYESFAHGGREYGCDPRMIESIYYQVPTTRWTFKQFTGKDLVTGEKIAYSPKHYAHVLTSPKLPPSAPDPLKPELSYRPPAHGFAMDEPYHVVFNRGSGNVAEIREALARYGILYGQHTMRALKDKIALSFIGVHACAIVGTGRYKGDDVVIYYETFGRNHRDYLEDGFFGPRLRVFPVKFFYQGLAFPHRLRFAIERAGEGRRVAVRDSFGRAFAPGVLRVRVDGRDVAVAKNTATVPLPAPAKPGVQRVEVFARARYQATPAEPDGYQRLFLTDGQTTLEIGEYARLVAAMTDRNRGSGRADDHQLEVWQAREEALRAELLSAVRGLPADRPLVRQLHAELTAQPTLAKSPLGKDLATLLKFKTSIDR